MRGTVRPFYRLSHFNAALTFRFAFNFTYHNFWECRYQNSLWLSVIEIHDRIDLFFYGACQLRVPAEMGGSLNIFE